MKKIFLIIIFLFLFPSKVIGFCSTEEKVRLNNLAKNLDFTYNYYYDKNNKIKFAITITNLHPDIYIVDKEHFDSVYYDFKSKNPKEITIEDYLTGGSYSFPVYGNTDNCKHELIMTQYKTVPAYNAYSEDPLCEGIEDFDLCKKWKSAPITYDEFVKLVTKYREETVITEPPKQEIIKDFNYYVGIVIDFMSRYYAYYISAMVLFGVLVLILRQKDAFKIE